MSPGVSEASDAARISSCDSGSWSGTDAHLPGESECSNHRLLMTTSSNIISIIARNVSNSDQEKLSGRRNVPWPEEDPSTSCAGGRQKENASTSSVGSGQEENLSTSSAGHGRENTSSSTAAAWKKSLRSAARPQAGRKPFERRRGPQAGNPSSGGAGHRQEENRSSGGAGGG